MKSPEEERAELARRRAAIDALDEEVLRLCAERLRHVVAIAGCKSRLGLGIVDAAREALLAGRYAEAARRHGLAPRVAEALYELLLCESKRHQREAGAGFPSADRPADGPAEEGMESGGPGR